MEDYDNSKVSDAADALLYQVYATLPANDEGTSVDLKKACKRWLQQKSRKMYPGYEIDKNSPGMRLLDNSSPSGETVPRTWLLFAKRSRFARGPNKLVLGERQLVGLDLDKKVLNIVPVQHKHDDAMPRAVVLSTVSNIDPIYDTRLALWIIKISFANTKTPPIWCTSVRPSVPFDPFNSRTVAIKWTAALRAMSTAPLVQVLKRMNTSNKQSQLDQIRACIAIQKRWRGKAVRLDMTHRSRSKGKVAQWFSGLIARGVVMLLSRSVGVKGVSVSRLRMEVYRICLLVAVVVYNVVCDMPGATLSWFGLLTMKRSAYVFGRYTNVSHNNNNNNNNNNNSSNARRVIDIPSTSRVLVCHAVAATLLTLVAVSTSRINSTTSISWSATPPEDAFVWWAGVVLKVVLRSGIMLFCSWSLGRDIDILSCGLYIGNPLCTLTAGLVGKLDIIQSSLALTAQAFSVLVVSVVVLERELQPPQTFTDPASLLVCGIMLLTAHPFNVSPRIPRWLSVSIYTLLMAATVNISSGQLVEPNMWLYMCLGGSSSFLAIVLQCTMAIVFSIAWLECSPVAVECDERGSQLSNNRSYMRSDSVSQQQQNISRPLMIGNQDSVSESYQVIGASGNGSFSNRNGYTSGTVKSRRKVISLLSWPSKPKSKLKGKRIRRGGGDGVHTDLAQLRRASATRVIPRQEP